MAVNRCDGGSVGQCAEQSAGSANADVRPAEVVEPHAAVGVDYDVVGGFERDVIASIIEPLKPAGREVHPLKASFVTGPARILEFAKIKTAIVADIECTIWPDRGTVRAAADVADRLGSPVPAAGDASACKFDDDDRPVCHDDGSFGKSEPFGNDLHLSILYNLVMYVLTRGGRGRNPMGRERELPVPAHHILSLPPPYDMPPYPADIFAGQTVLVTGGGSGMGLAMARAFAQGGAHVAVMGRSIERAEEGAAEIAKLGVCTHAMSCDVRLPDAVAAAFDEAEEALGPVSLLANNAGANFPILAEDISSNAWNAVTRIAIDGTFNCSTEFARRRIVAGQGGAIVNNSAQYIWTGFPGDAH